MFMLTSRPAGSVVLACALTLGWMTGPGQLEAKVSAGQASIAAGQDEGGTTPRESRRRGARGADGAGGTGGAGGVRGGSGGEGGEAGGAGGAGGTGGGGGGAIIDAPNDLRQFSPPDTSVEVDAFTTSLSQVLTDLGPDARTWYQHVQTLSNPYFEGRAPGSAGMDRAADYVEFWFRQAGLQPAFADAATGNDSWTSYRQPLQLPGRGVEVRMAEAAVGGKDLAADEDFIVMGCSGSGVVEAPLTFVGYGIAEGRDGYSSFNGDERLDGRVAVLFRYEPLDEEGRSLWSDRRFSEHAAILPKLTELEKRGAAAVVMVNPPESMHGRRRLDSTDGTRFGGTFSIPMIQVSQETAERMLREASGEERALLEWRRAADTGEVKSVALRDDVKLRIGADVSARYIDTANIGGVIPGSGDLAHEWIVIGAHYDHVGFGAFGTMPRNRGKLHPGADDNASGTAAMLVLAQRLRAAAEKAPEDADRRSILFLAFTAEESGLEGSRHFVRNPTLDAESINLMINLDMVGRLRNNTLSLGGVGTAENFQAILEPHIAASGLTAALDPSGRGPSDHANFYGASIPVLFAFTGMHSEYHSPLDTADTVNPAGAVRIMELVESVVEDLATRPERLVFRSSDASEGSDRGYAPVRLGITPGVGDLEEGAGIVVEDVSAGTSAEEAGILAGDVLISWNGEELTDARSLVENLRKHKPGDTVQLVLLRNGERVVVNATLKESTGRRGG